VAVKVVIDIEANALHNPTKIWLVVCKDIDTGEYHIFRDLNDDNIRKLHVFLDNCSVCIGHHYLGYDGVHLENLTGYPLDTSRVIDTLIVSKLVDFSRKGHSVEAYGEEFGISKGKCSDFSKYSPELEERCVGDVDITEKIYLKHKAYIESPKRWPSIDLEQRFQLVCNDLEKNGFAFNTAKAQQLLHRVTTELATLDADILSSFKPKEVLIREFTPKATKFGTISRSSVPRNLHDRISEFNVGEVYRHTRLVDFNPSSHKQIIEVLNEAGWKPIDKTKTHIDTERALNLGKYEVGLTEADHRAKLEQLKKTGWKVNEVNLETLPPSAPKPARLLAKRILLESRRRTLTEWLALVQTDGRIHGRFYAIGAWTHRMAHQNPNTANIPNEFDTAGKKKLYGKELRSFWCAPKNRLLVGVDAEGIQLRIFAHYIDDPDFTSSLVRGKKDDKTDPHSLNQSVLGSVCKSRAAAKRFVYALLLGAGLGKLTEILGCSPPEAEEALDRLLKRYTGWAYLKEKVFPKDAKRGWFEGLDSRAVQIPGGNQGTRKHLAMSGYLQNGEAVCMKKATLLWWPKLKDYDARIVNFVHDEWQVECPNDNDVAMEIAAMMADSLRQVGEELKLKCPLAGSYWNDDLKDYTIATNWSKTH
jgi:DNA polymerase I-like protein with 3'-5' exonuclease and polymerase domains